MHFHFRIVIQSQRSESWILSYMRRWCAAAKVSTFQRHAHLDGRVFNISICWNESFVVHGTVHFCSYALDLRWGDSPTLVCVVFFFAGLRHECQDISLHYYRFAHRFLLYKSNQTKFYYSLRNHKLKIQLNSIYTYIWMRVCDDARGLNSISILCSDWAVVYFIIKLKFAYISGGNWCAAQPRHTFYYCYYDWWPLHIFPILATRCCRKNLWR